MIPPKNDGLPLFSYPYRTINLIKLNLRGRDRSEFPLKLLHFTDSLNPLYYKIKVSLIERTRRQDYGVYYSKIVVCK